MFKIKGPAGKAALDRWLGLGRAAAASRPSSTSPPRSGQHRPEIDNALDHDLSNALIESMNTKIRQIARTAYGFANPDALIALALLAHGGHRPHLPGRTTHT